MTHLIFNSVPRSGQVFLSNVARHAFDADISTAHLPEIFVVKDLFHISIFRNPSDSIASALNKFRENFAFLELPGSPNFNFSVKKAVETYDKYLNAVSDNLDNVHVVRFEELIQDYRPVIEGISNRFSLVKRIGYDTQIVLDKSSPIWSDKYDGHMPREKDDLRLMIEDRVSSMQVVHELTERYHAFLGRI